jgi:hypothetical protein
LDGETRDASLLDLISKRRPDTAYDLYPPHNPNTRDVRLRDYFMDGPFYFRMIVDQGRGSTTRGGVVEPYHEQAPIAKIERTTTSPLALSRLTHVRWSRR